MVLKFKEFEYMEKFSSSWNLTTNEKLDFAKLEYPKSGKSLHIFETMVDCNIICKKYAIGLF